MSNKKISELTELTALTDDDLLVVVDDVAGTPTTKKITKANALSNYLAKDNTTEFTPDANYEPATKKYVDDSVSQAGGGDMLKSVYDPTNINSSAFNADNHISGTTNKVFTATEQSKLVGIETGANVGVVPNTAITGATKTKITYDSKGLVTAGADATTADIADSADKRYITDAQLTILGNTSGTNTGDQDLTALIPKSLVDAKGDLITATADNTPAVLAKGTDGYYLKANSSKATGLEWVELSTAGQTTYDAIVASSGGTHTTLAGALASASNGWRILVTDNTTETADISTSLTDLTIVGASRSCTIGLSTYDLAFTGARLTIQNLKFDNTSGFVSFSGANARIDNCYFYSNAYNASYNLIITGSYSVMQNCHIQSDATTTGTPQRIAQISGGESIVISNNYFQVPCRNTTANSGSIYISASKTHFKNNRISSTSNASVAYLLIFTGVSCIVNGNEITGLAGNYAIYCNGAVKTIVTNNQITNGTPIRSIWFNGSDGVITNNLIFISVTNGFGIYYDGNTCIISDNWVGMNNGTGDTCIYLASGNDCTIANNLLYYGATGININNANSNRTTVMGNNISGPITKIVNNGVATVLKNNIGATPVEESAVILCKNTSGGTINAGSVVVFKSVAGGNEVTTTTSAGDNKVYGVATANINNNAFGYIQTLGKTTILKVDGTTDIAIGDYLSTFTTAGVAQKASAGQFVFAIALEAYTANDSNGVLDALLITPKLI